MNLSYKILWYDNEPTYFDSLKDQVKELIEEFELISSVTLSQEETVDSHYIAKERFDLIVVDYNLNKIKGDTIIEELRKCNIYTDVIFYSSAYPELLEALRNKGLEGVFTSERRTDVLIEKMKYLIDKNVKRWQDVTNLRGIFMDSTSEYDSNIRDILLKLWPSFTDENKKEIDNYIKDDLINEMNQYIQKKCQSYMECREHIIIPILESRIFDSSKRARLFNKILSIDNKLTKDLNKQYNDFETLHRDDKANFCDRYNNEILDYRNSLAHAKKEIDGNNDIFIGKIKGEDLKFDIELCRKLRKFLIEYHSLLNNMYEYIEKTDEV